MRQPDLSLIRDFSGPITAAPADDALHGMQTAVKIRPELAVDPLDSDDVVRAVHHAAAQRTPVAVSSTGHGATSLNGGLLIRTHRMSHVTVDPHTRTADIGAGATWGQVIEAAAKHGLAPLSGTATTVGAIGYTLGGGISPLSRAFGYAADHVVDLDIVTPDGRLRYVSADDDPDLFWAARGAGAHLGVVTRMKCRLIHIDQVLAGAISITVNDWAEVTDRFVTWSADLPESTGALLSLKSFPDLPNLPDAIRGKRTATIYVTSIGAESDAADQIRALGGIVRESPRLTPTPPADLTAVFNEPAGPHAFQGDAIAVSDVNAEPLAAGLGSLVNSARPQFLFIHRLGGAMSREPDQGTAIGNRAAEYLVRIVTSPAPTDDPAAVAIEQDDVLRSMSIEPTGRVPNFLFGDNLGVARVTDCYTAEDLRRLGRITAQVDPDRLLMPARGRLDGAVTAARTEDSQHREPTGHRDPGTCEVNSHG